MTVSTARTKTASKRLAIVKAAAICFAEQGFESATIRQIADQAGLLAGSIYYHFATKEEMLHEVMMSLFTTAMEGTREAARRADDPEMALRNLVQFSLGRSLQHWAQHQTLVRNREILMNNPSFHYVREMWEVMRDEWRAVFRAGIETGKFRRDLDPEVSTQVVTRMINSCVSWYRPDGRMTPEQLTDFICNFVLAASIAAP